MGNYLAGNGFQPCYDRNFVKSDFVLARFHCILSKPYLRPVSGHRNHEQRLALIILWASYLMVGVIYFASAMKSGDI